MTGAGERNTSLWLDVAAFLFVAALIQLVVGSYNHLAGVDEIYHRLAARSWLSDGTLAVGNGAYARAAGYTILLALVQSVLGDSLAVARGLSTVFGLMWAATLFLWLRTVGGRVVAWIAALLLVADPEFIDLSHTIRFYTLHGFLFLLGSVGWYTVVTRRFSFTGALALTSGSVAALAAAIHFQLTTIIGLAALGIWTAIELGPACVARARADRRVAIAFGVAVLASVAVAVAASDWLGALVELYWGYYRGVVVWAMGNQNNILFYNDYFMERYPLFWALFPVAALVAVRRDRKFGIFCGSVFIAAFVLQSFGGMKGGRYIYYVIPFFFAVWAMGLNAMVAPVRALVSGATASLLGERASARWLRAGRIGCYTAIGAFLIAGTPALRITVKMARDWPLSRLQVSTGWRDDGALLRSLMAKADVVLTPDGQQALYYLGRADYLVAVMKVDESNSGAEFGIDRRTGLPAISTPESFQLVMSCYASGLFIASRSNWRHRYGGATDAVADLIQSKAREIPFPPKSGLRVFAWKHAGWSGPPPACADLPALATPR
ncbi:MAG: hypothetical protein ACE5DS_06875 [Kiloniellaceae bacterium]